MHFITFSFQEKLKEVMNSTNTSTNDGHRLQLTVEVLSDKRIFIYIPCIIYTCILLIIGIPGNAAVFYVYLTRWKPSSTRVLIITLSVLDFINCLFTYPFELANLLNPFTFDYAVLCKVFRFATYTCNSGGALLLIAIAIDRYTRICKPYSNPMNPKAAKVISVVIVITSVLTCWPSLVIYGTQSQTITPTVELKFCLIEDQYRNTQYPLAYLLVQCACTVVIFSILVSIYTIIGTQVCRRWKFRTRSTKSISDADDDVIPEIPSSHCNEAKMWKEETTELATENETGVKSQTSRQEQKIKVPFLTQLSSTLQKKRRVVDKRTIRIGKTTVMLFVVTIVYILCFSPFLVLASHRSVFPEKWRYLSDSGEIAYQFFLRSYLANSAVNPIIYSFFNPVFRQECLKLHKKLLWSRFNRPNI